MAESGNFQMPEAYDTMTALLQRRRDFTALFAISDAMAVAAIKALDDAGLRVPQDCSVIGIDGIVMSNYARPTLTTLVQPAEQIAEAGVRILVDMIEGRGGNRHVQVSAQLRPGHSVCDRTDIG